MAIVWDRESVEKQVASAKTNLNLIENQIQSLEASAQALRDYIDASENMLRMMSPEMPLFAVSQEKRSPGSALREHGLRALIRDVLQQSDEPMELREIWNQVKARGATTGSDDPEKAVMYALYSMRRHNIPVDRVGQKRWRWITEDERG